MHKTRTATLMAGVAALGLMAQTAHAATDTGLLLEFFEQSGTIVVTLSGSVSLPPETDGGSVVGAPQVNPDGGLILGYGATDISILSAEEDGGGEPREAAGAFFNLYTLSGGSPFVGGGGPIEFNSWMGDGIYLLFSPDGNLLGLQPELIPFLAGDDDLPENGVGTLRSFAAIGQLDASFFNLGVEPGESVFSITGPLEIDTLLDAPTGNPPPDLTVRFTREDVPGVIPLPPALPLMLGGLGLLGLMGWRRRRG